EKRMNKLVTLLALTLALAAPDMVNAGAKMQEGTLNRTEAAALGAAKAYGRDTVVQLERTAEVIRDNLNRPIKYRVCIPVSQVSALEAKALLVSGVSLVNINNKLTGLCRLDYNPDKDDALSQGWVETFTAGSVVIANNQLEFSALPSVEANYTLIPESVFSIISPGVSTWETKFKATQPTATGKAMFLSINVAPGSGRENLTAEIVLREGEADPTVTLFDTSQQYGSSVIGSWSYAATHTLKTTIESLDATICATEPARQSTATVTMDGSDLFGSVLVNICPRSVSQPRFSMRAQSGATTGQIDVHHNRSKQN
ncbi:MAG: hypothetical protein V3T23_03965, partial [Nitrososphaerales archaeon]